MDFNKLGILLYAVCLIATYLYVSKNKEASSGSKKAPILIAGVNGGGPT